MKGPPNVSGGDARQRLLQGKIEMTNSVRKRVYNTQRNTFAGLSSYMIKTSKFHEFILKFGQAAFMDT